MNKSFLLELRELALVHHNDKLRQALQLWADKAELTLRDFEDNPSRENLTTLNGIWTRAILFYETVVLNDPSGGKGGQLPVPTPSKKTGLKKRVA